MDTAQLREAVFGVYANANKFRTVIVAVHSEFGPSLLGTE